MQSPIRTESYDNVLEGIVEFQMRAQPHFTAAAEDAAVEHHRVIDDDEHDDDEDDDDATRKCTNVCTTTGEDSTTLTSVEPSSKDTCCPANDSAPGKGTVAARLGEGPKTSGWLRERPCSTPGEGAVGRQAG